MKARIFTIVMIFLSVQAIGQYNTKLVDTTKIWSIAWETTGGPPPPLQGSTWFRFSGDTIVNGYTYKKILYSQDENMNIWELSTELIREENGKVYERLWNGKEDGLAYDFNVELYDTITINYLPENPIDVVVYEIDSILIQPANQLRKRIGIGMGGVEEYWIEGIGSTNHMLYSCMYLLGWVGSAHSLLCYFENDELIYGGGNCFITSVSERKDNHALDYHFSPNPVKDIASLVIQNPDNRNYTITIFNTFGQFLHKYSVFCTDKISISANEFERGVYFYSIFRDNQLVYRGKFMVL